MAGISSSFSWRSLAKFHHWQISATKMWHLINYTASTNCNKLITKKLKYQRFYNNVSLSHDQLIIFWSLSNSMPKSKNTVSNKQQSQDVQINDNKLWTFFAAFSYIWETLQPEIPNIILSQLMTEKYYRYEFFLIKSNI